MERIFYEGRTFENMNFPKGKLSDTTFEACVFKNCVFDECEFLNVDFDECVFTGCRIANIKPQKCKMKAVRFEKCSLVGINWKLMEYENNFCRTFESVIGCSFKYNTFSDMNLTNTDFSACDIKESIFAQCRLQESSFNGCRLDNTEFFKCDLRKCDFRGASGYVMDVMNNTLKGARFSFPEVVSLLDSLEIEID